MLTPRLRKFNPMVLTVIGVLTALALAFLGFSSASFPRAAAQASPSAAEDAVVAELKAEIEHLRLLQPDQAHAMKDVGAHFANLWFAAKLENWPLADFYLAETRSHLKWAVRIKPVRQTAAGDLDLNGILEAIDSSLLAKLKESIDGKDKVRFEETYRQSLEGCYACHKASEKPYLRPQIPAAPKDLIINFDPKAGWPQ